MKRCETGWTANCSMSNQTRANVSAMENLPTVTHLCMPSEGPGRGLKYEGISERLGQS